MKCINEFNKFYVDKFKAQAAGLRDNRNKNLEAQVRKVIGSISKYPLPIVTSYQIGRIEGVGKTISATFHDYMAEYAATLVKSKEDFISKALKLNTNKKNQSEPGVPSKKKLVELSAYSSTWNLLITLHLLYLQNDCLTFMLDDVKAMSETFIHQILLNTQVAAEKITTYDFESLKQCDVVESFDNFSIKCKRNFHYLAEKEEKKSKIEVKLDDEKELKVRFFGAKSGKKSKSVSKKQENASKRSKKDNGTDHSLDLFFKSQSVDILQKFRKFQSESLSDRIVLLVDICEGKSGGDHLFYEEELTKLGVRAERRKLPVGDFAWVIEDSQMREFMLPFIVERKELTDLSSSILDGRYGEQKMRLKKCGIDNIFYLFEGTLTGFKPGQKISAQAIKTAIFNTLTIHDMNIEKTASPNETVEWLHSMHRNISKQYKTVSPRLQTAEQFFSTNSKTSECTVKETLAKQIRALPNFGIEATSKILSLFSTPNAILSAFSFSAKPEKLVNIVNYLKETEGQLNPVQIKLIEEEETFNCLVKTKVLSDKLNATLTTFYGKRS